MRPHAGDILGGKYRIVGLIGDGGMGSVYEARHEVLGTQVALKFLHPELARRPGLVSRFMQEARVSASIQSPHVTRVTDVEQSADGAAYIVMELLTGQALQDLLDQRTRLPRDQAIDYALQMLSGLEAAHALGVVHRDLKPDNVFITQTSGGPVLKLLDFGIAKLRASSEFQKGLTRPGAIMGTPEYMAPEQAYSADQVDHRADLYALGAILYEMLSGERPAYGDDAQVIVAQVQSGQVRALTDHDPTIPPALAQVVHRAMAPLPQNRFATATELRLELARFAGNLSHAGKLAATPTPIAGPSGPPDERSTTVDAPPPPHLSAQAAPTGFQGGAVGTRTPVASPPITEGTPNPGQHGLGLGQPAQTPEGHPEKGGTQEVAPQVVQQRIAQLSGQMPAAAPAPPGQGQAATGQYPMHPGPHPGLGAPQQPAPGKSRKGPIALLALVLGAGVAAGVIALVVNQQDDDDPLPSATSFPTGAPPTTISPQVPGTTTTAPTTPLPPTTATATPPTPGTSRPRPRPRDAGGAADGGSRPDAGVLPPFAPLPLPSSLPPLPSGLPPLPTTFPFPFPPAPAPSR